MYLPYVVNAVLALIAAFAVTRCAGTEDLPPPVYEYHGKVVEVYDGDTMTVLLDLGFDVHFRARLRIEGIDAPELRGPERVEGLRVRDAVRERLTGKRVVVTSKGKGKYGRWIAAVLFVHEGEVVDLGGWLLREGMAERYE